MSTTKKIIVVDDDPGILYAMQLFLEEEGYMEQRHYLYYGVGVGVPPPCEFPVLV